MIFKKVGKLDRFGEVSWKGWVATILFGAIILVFALSDIGGTRGGDEGLGVAAMVNDSAISIAEYRGRVENIEQNAKGQLDQIPEAQRRMYSQQMRRQALEQLIFGELVYQAASSRGVRAADGEVRDAILQYPFLSDNGRFSKDRYRNFLASISLSSEDFEHQIRKQIVSQKVQELFVGSAAPTREELRRSRVLANQKVNIRFVELTPDDFKRPGMMEASEVQAYAAANKAQIEKYYNDNKIEFTDEERVKARHILIKKDDKRPEAEAQRMAVALKPKLTPQNFAQLAGQNSDDPGSKAKGGDLGEFSRGRMVPEFENAVFALKEGQISEPIQTSFGYHIVYVEKKLPAVTKPLSAAEGDIARKLLLQTKQGEILGKVRSMVEKGSKAEVDGWVNRTGLKWQESGEFDLASVTVPKLGNSPGVVSAVLRKGRSGGLVNQLIDNTGRHLIVDVVSWKEAPDANADVEGIERMVAYRKSNDLIESWSKQIEAVAKIQRNPRLIQ